MLQQPLLCYLYKMEKNAKTMPFKLFNEAFEVIINSKKDEEMLYNFDPTIDVRHVKSGYFGPHELSWPVLSSSNFSSYKILYFLIHISGPTNNSYRGKDA